MTNMKAELEKKLSGLWAVQDALTNNEKIEKIVELSQYFANMANLGFAYNSKSLCNGTISCIFLKYPMDFRGEHDKTGRNWREFVECEYRRYIFDLEHVDSLANALSEMFVDAAYHLLGLEGWSLTFDKCKPKHDDIPSLYPQTVVTLGHYDPVKTTNHQATLDFLNKKFNIPTQSNLPKIKDVKFNNPATIVFWEDGTKTVVRAHDEGYDPEKGLAMAISKKVLGNKYEYYHTFLHWFKKYNKDELRMIGEIDEVHELPGREIAKVIKQGSSTPPSVVNIEFYIYGKDEKNKVIDALDEILYHYGRVTVAELYDIISVASEHADTCYAWANLEHMKVEYDHSERAYRFTMPKAFPLNR